MPKQIINLIGIVVSLGVVALGLFLVAAPLYVQSLDQTVQTAAVAATNEVYQAQVDQLHVEEERLGEINSSVAALQRQLPPTGQLDDVFEVIGLAAESTGVTVQAVTAGAPAAYVVRIDPTAEGGAAAEAPANASAGATTEEPADAGTDTGAGPGTTGRQQVDFAISVAATDASQVTAFLDALRAGPRLLSSVTATSARTGEGGFEVQVGALTFIDATG